MFFPVLVSRRGADVIEITRWFNERLPLVTHFRCGFERDGHSASFLASQHFEIVFDCVSPATGKVGLEFCSACRFPSVRRLPSHESGHRPRLLLVDVPSPTRI